MINVRVKKNQAKVQARERSIPEPWKGVLE